MEKREGLFSGLVGMVKDLPSNLSRDMNLTTWSNGKIWLFISLLVLQIYFLDFTGTWVAILGSLVAVVNIICVSLMANEKISTFYFGVIYSVGYLFVAIENNLKGEIFTTMFFFIMNFVGYIAWKRSIEDVNTEVSEEDKYLDIVGKKLDAKGWLATLGIFLVTWGILWQVLGFLDSNKPLVDASLVAVTFIAQILATKRYRENWLLWILSNILMIILYHDLSPQMVVMSIALTINCIVGYVEFTKSGKKYEKELKEGKV